MNTPITSLSAVASAKADHYSLLTMLCRRFSFIFTTLALGCLALSPAPKAFGVVPAPDGGYPGGNTAEGQNALLSLTTGVYNTAVGWYSLWSNTEGSFNTAVGAGTLLFNTADENTAVGAAALLSNSTGFGNTANGALALLTNITGNYNTATGAGALQHNVADNNTATGFQALFSNTTGNYNTALGAHSLDQNTDGVENTAIGFSALFLNTGSYNTAVGVQALHSNGSYYNTAVGNLALRNHISGSFNTALGAGALEADGSGSGNTAVGDAALFNNISGTLNTGCGYGALSGNVAGTGNTAVGCASLPAMTDGTANTAIGYQSLYNLGSGSYNIALTGGYNLMAGDFNIYIGNDGAGNESGVIRIGSTCCQGQAFIAGIYGTIISGGTGVYVNSDGQLGIPTSSIRFKDEVRPMDKASEAILALRPVSFRYKKEFDPQGIPQFGLVAEEVQKVNPDLVVHDANGEPYSVRYEQINAMLLNEFLKEHRKVEELEATVAQQQKRFAKQERQIDALTSGLQKVSAQIEVRNTQPQMALNKQ